MRALLLLVLFATPAFASTEDEWLASLTERVVDDLEAGKPLLVSVHVPLCDTSIIPCGNAKLGDGDNPETNLYWATTPGFGRWFARKGSGWTRVKREESPETDVLALHVYRRTMRTPAAWKNQGAPSTFPLEVVVRAWRGTAIDKALAKYASEISTDGGAHIVAWVGHNRLMDLESFDWPAPSTTTKGTIAIACHTAAYMEETVSAATRVPLLMTRDFLFANAAPLEAAVLAFASGGSYAKIRSESAAAYAKVRDKPVAKIAGAFTNPSDRRWKKQ